MQEEQENSQDDQENDQKITEIVNHLANTAKKSKGSEIKLAIEGFDTTEFKDFHDEWIKSMESTKFKTCEYFRLDINLIKTLIMSSQFTDLVNSCKILICTDCHMPCTFHSNCDKYTSRKKKNTDISDIDNELLNLTCETCGLEPSRHSSIE